MVTLVTIIMVAWKIFWIKRRMNQMWWKVFNFKQNNACSNSKNIYYGLKRNKTPPSMKLLELLEKDLLKIIENIKFRNISY